MKWLIFSFLTLLFLIPLVSAQDFSIDIDKNPDYPFYAAQTDFIKLTINNPLAEDWFTISVIGVPQEWVTATEFLLRVPSMGSNFIQIKVSPSRDAIPNIYQYFLKVTRFSSGDMIEDNLLINVVQVTSAILKDISLSCKVCVDTVNVSGEVVNVGSRKLDLALVLKYANRQKTISIEKLDVNEKREFETSLDLKDLEPKDYSIEMALVDANGNILYTESVSFSVPVIENVVYDRDISTTPFGSLITVSAMNNGNIVSDAELKSISPQSWYYLFSGPNPTGMIIGGQYFWKVTLGPGESTNITYTEIYWPTYTLILFIVLVAAFIYWQSTALTFRKEVMGRQRIKFGRDVSVSLHLRNRRKEIGKVAVRDIVPSKFSVVSKFETVKPIIRKIVDGVELVWRIGDLKPHEERVLHYTVRPTSESGRKVHLPSALVKAVSGKGLVVKHSNRVALYPEEGEVKIIPVKVTK